MRKNRIIMELYKDGSFYRINLGGKITDSRSNKEVDRINVHYMKNVVKDLENFGYKITWVSNAVNKGLVKFSK